MRVLVTGSGGFLGAAAVEALARSGHEVRALVRRRDQFAATEARGGHPVLGDLLVPPGLEDAARGCELAIHLAQPVGGTMEERRRVRVEGAHHLVAAMRRAGVPRLIVGSGYWVYPDTPGEITEEGRVQPMSISQVNFEAEEVGRAAAARGEVESIVVRPGMVYGNGSWFREMALEIRSGTYSYVGAGTNHLSPVHREDAGEAFRVVAERGSPGATYLVVDDHPVATREFAEFVASQLGVPPPRSLSMEDAAKEWGTELALLNAANRAASNARLRSLGWIPRFPSYTDGVPPVLQEIVHPG